MRMVLYDLAVMCNVVEEQPIRMVHLAVTGVSVMWSDGAARRTVVFALKLYHYSKARGQQDTYGDIAGCRSTTSSDGSEVSNEPSVTQKKGEKHGTCG
jgi:hypothetical protein